MEMLGVGVLLGGIVGFVIGYVTAVALWRQGVNMGRESAIDRLCDLILYFRLGRVGKKWEEMGRCWI